MQTGYTGNCFFEMLRVVFGDDLVEVLAPESPGLRREDLSVELLRTALRDRFLAADDEHPEDFLPFMISDHPVDLDELDGHGEPRYVTPAEVAHVLGTMGEWNSRAGDYTPQLAARLFELNLALIGEDGVVVDYSPRGERTEADPQGPLLHPGRPRREVVRVTHPVGHFLGTRALGAQELSGGVVPVDHSTDVGQALDLMEKIATQVPELKKLAPGDLELGTTTRRRNVTNLKVALG